MGKSRRKKSSHQLRIERWRQEQAEELVSVVGGLRFVDHIPTDAEIVAILGYLPPVTEGSRLDGELGGLW